jgi:hypothetical protein
VEAAASGVCCGGFGVCGDEEGEEEERVEGVIGVFVEDGLDMIPARVYMPLMNGRDGVKEYGFV